jgi:hypothetical protein
MLFEGRDYADEHMKGASVSGSKRGIFSIAWSARREGLVLEFGVWSGRTIDLVADRVGPSRTVHGFDSFEGLPQEWFLRKRSRCPGRIPLESNEGPR